MERASTAIPVYRVDSATSVDAPLDYSMLMHDFSEVEKGVVHLVHKATGERIRSMNVSRNSGEEASNTATRELFGDKVKRYLSLVGITQKRYSDFLVYLGYEEDCGCIRRQELYNQIHLDIEELGFGRWVALHVRGFLKGQSYGDVRGHRKAVDGSRPEGNPVPEGDGEGATGA